MKAPRKIVKVTELTQLEAEMRRLWSRTGELASYYKNEGDKISADYFNGRSEGLMMGIDLLRSIVNADSDTTR